MAEWYEKPKVRIGGKIAVLVIWTLVLVPDNVDRVTNDPSPWNILLSVLIVGFTVIVGLEIARGIRTIRWESQQQQHDRSRDEGSRTP